MGLPAGTAHRCPRLGGGSNLQLEVVGWSARAGTRHSDTGQPLTRVDPYHGKTGVAKDVAVLYGIVTGGWVSLLLLCIPLGFASEYMGWGAVATFSLVSDFRGEGEC